MLMDFLKGVQIGIISTLTIIGVIWVFIKKQRKHQRDIKKRV